jgi:hypothetical protein
VKPKPTVPPHLPVVDDTVPPDQHGHRYCRRCQLAIVDGDKRHTMPDVPAQAVVAARYEHEEN